MVPAKHSEMILYTRIPPSPHPSLIAFFFLSYFSLTQTTPFLLWQLSQVVMTVGFSQLDISTWGRFCLCHFLRAGFWLWFWACLSLSCIHLAMVGPYSHRHEALSDVHVKSALYHLVPLQDEARPSFYCAFHSIPPLDQLTSNLV